MSQENTIINHSLSASGATTEQSAGSVTVSLTYDEGMTVWSFIKAQLDTMPESAFDVSFSRKATNLIKFMEKLSVEMDKASGIQRLL